MRKPATGASLCRFASGEFYHQRARLATRFRPTGQASFKQADHRVDVGSRRKTVCPFNREGCEKLKLRQVAGIIYAVGRQECRYTLSQAKRMVQHSVSITGPSRKLSGRSCSLTPSFLEGAGRIFDFPGVLLCGEKRRSIRTTFLIDGLRLRLDASRALKRHAPDLAAARPKASDHLLR
jgi:hypothetical protein